MVSGYNCKLVKRPAIWASGAFMAGIAAGVGTAKYDALIPAVIILFSLYLLIMGLILFTNSNNCRRMISAAIICIAFFTAAAVYSFIVYSERLDVYDYGEEERLISATVLDRDKLDDDTVRYEVDCVTIDSESIGTHMLITVKNSTSLLLPGDRVELYSEVCRPSQARNSGLFDYREFLANKRIYYTAYADEKDVTVTEYTATGTNAFRYTLNRFKHDTINSCREYLSPEALGIVYAITSGDSVYIENTVYEQYRNTGTAHVLAISGLHVGFIVMFIGLLTRRLKKYSLSYTLINIAAVWVYIIFSGMNVSAVRAGIFFTLFGIGRLLRLRCSVTNVAFITAFIILAAEPMALFSVSFQLSFSAALALGILAPALKSFIFRHVKSLPSEAVNGASTVICASVGVVIPIAYHYNTVSLVSILVNLIIVPLYSYIVLFGFAVMLAAVIRVPVLISAAATVVNGLVRIAHIILEGISGFEYAYINVASPGVITILAALIVLLILSVECPSFIKKKLVPIACCLFVITAHIVIPYLGIGGTYTVSFIDVGQAECSLIVTPSNKTVMIDAGSSYGTQNTAEYVIAPYLLKHGNTKIDYLVLSHAHSDHIGETEALAELVDIGNIVYSCPDGDTQFDKIKELAVSKGINLINMYYTSSISADASTYINKVSTYYDSSDTNAQSLAVEIKCGENSLLFAGDMPSCGLDTLTCSGNILIYKASHHGSVTSLSTKIDELRPLYTVVCTKKNNVYGLPSEDAISRYEEYSNVLLVQEHGEIRFTFNDNGIRVFKYIA